MRIRAAILLCALLASKPASADDSWPEWRGATGQGVSNAKNLPVKWSEKSNVAWKLPVPGLGWSTPVVADGIVWVTSAVDIPATKEQAKERRKTTTNSQPLKISNHVSLRAIGIDLKSGKKVHDVEVLSEKNPQIIHRLNSYASPSPIIEGGRLYCHFGPSGIACLDIASNKVVWTNRSLKVKHENGPGSSPVLWNNLLIIHCDGIDQQYIIALDKQTGKQAWKRPRTGKLNTNPQLKKSYATSLVAELNGRQQVISPAADWIYGYDPTSGKELWKLNYGQLGFSNAARPVAGGGLIYTCTGYMKSQLLAIRVEKVGGALQPKVVWKYTKQVPNVGSALLVGNEIYFASDNGIASCIDAQTGELHWSKRIGKKFWASPIAADGRVYFVDETGTTTVVAQGTEFKQLARNKLSGTMYAAPAAIDGHLVVRTKEAVYCIKP